MHANATSIAMTALLLIGMSAGVAQRTMAAQLVQECGPPGGVWGPDNLLRDKIEKYSDGMAVYKSQHFAEENKARWLTSAPFPWGEKKAQNAIGTYTTISSDGDNFKVSARGGRSHTYFGQFSCKPVTAAPR